MLENAAATTLIFREKNEPIPAFMLTRENTTNPEHRLSGGRPRSFRRFPKGLPWTAWDWPNGWSVPIIR